MTTTISATELKNKVSEVLNRVYYSGNTVIIEKHGKPVAKIIPADKKLDLENLRKALNDSFGSLPDFPDVTKDRRSRKRKIPALFP